MPDPIDQNTPPSTPTTPMSDPQAMVDAALGTPSTATTPAPAPVVPPAAPAMPTLPPMPEPTIPAPIPAPTPAVSVGDDTPLAFMTPPPSTTTDNPSAPLPNLGTSVPMDAVPPAPVMTTKPKQKNGIGKIVGLLVGFLALVGVGGSGAYWYYYDYRTIPLVAPVNVPGEESCTGCDGGHELVWRNGQCVWRARLCGGGEEGTPTDTGNQAQCTGCREGYEVRWNGSACIKVKQCDYGQIDSSSSCEGSGGFWCNVVDSSGQRHEFCGDNAGRACYTQAIEDHGITMQIGKVECECPATGSCEGKGLPTKAVVDAIINAQVSQETQNAQLAEVAAQCKNGGNFTGAGTESFICRAGVVGTGNGTDPGVPYTGGACTALNGRPYTGNLGCFCGTIQVDTPTGHTSYSSTCGCNEEETVNNPTHRVCNTTTYQCETVNGAGADTCTTDAQCAPNVPVMACVGLTQAPVAPVVGDKVTFTCAGTITPATAGTLSYKFRYSLNGGATTAMINKTTTTTELNIAACGEYKVECQTCATIAGVLKCDPNWVGATQ